MRKTLKPLPFLALAPLPAPVHAVAIYASKTSLSAKGIDSHTCSRASPCATFPGAYSKTAAGGQILVVGSGADILIGNCHNRDFSSSGGTGIIVGSNNLKPGRPR